MKGDTLMVSLEYFKLTSQEGFPSEEFGLKGSPESKPPMAHKGKALFRYSLAGKAYYFSIKEIKEMENVYAP
jgi:hypothetical protein